MFTLWFFVATVVYSTNPGGAPPFQAAHVYLSELDHAACRARMTHVLLHPKTLVKVTSTDQPTWAKATVLSGWRCVPLEVGD